MDDLPEGFDAMLHKIIVVVVLLIPLFVDSIVSRNLIEECFHYVRRKAEASAKKKDSPQKKTNEIERGIKFNMGSTLMSWCPSDSFRPDFILTVLGKFELDLTSSVVWDTVPPFSSGQALFGRVVAAFADEELALSAAKELSKLSKSAITLQLSEVINVLIENELCQPQLGTTRIVITSRAGISSRKKKSKLRELLEACGEVVQLNFRRRSATLAADTTGLVEICEVSYKYVSQAYVAMYSIDGVFFHPTQSNLFVKVEESVKERRLAKTLRSRLKEMLDEKKAVSCLKTLSLHTDGE